MYHNRRNFFKETKTKKSTFVMNDKDFPSFFENPCQKETSLLNYAEKTKMEYIKPVDVLNPGWVEIQLNPITRIKTLRYGEKQVMNEYKPTFLDVLEKLEERYESWKEMYIESYGEEEYEKYYKFPNYDYYYFDRLDEVEEYVSDETN